MALETIEHISSLWRDEEQRRQSGAWPAEIPAFPKAPAGRYNDRAFYDLERKHLWRGAWIFVGHACELPTHGSYVTRNIDGLRIAIVRGKDGVPRAFHNVCQHRGALLLRGESGETNTINCPYHCWSYALDGALRFVPEEGDFPGLDKSKKGMRAIHCQVFRGFIFINLSETPEPIETAMGGMADVLADVPIEGATLFRKVTLEADCNWKFIHDAFSETYHVQYVHPQSVNLAIDSRYTARYMLKGGHNAMVVKARLQEGSNLVNVFDRQGAAQKRSGEDLRPVTKISQRSYNIFPNLTVPIAENLFPILAVWPNGLDKCVVEIRFMKLPGGGGSLEADAEVVDAFIAIAGEDLSAIQGIHDCLANGGLEEVELGYGEQFIVNFHLELDRVIGAARIPAHLRMPFVALPLIDGV